MFTVSMKNLGGGFSKTQWAMQMEAAYWWAKAWNDSEFQRRVLDYQWTVDTYSGWLWWRRKTGTVKHNYFAYTDDSRDVVLSTMLSGRETLKPELDSEGDVEIILANKRGVLGWTYENTLTQWLSAWFINSSSIAEQAGNRAHEYMHKLGYDHPFKATWDRPYTAPYAIGDLVVAWVKANYVKGEYALHGHGLVKDATAT